MWLGAWKEGDAAEEFLFGAGGGIAQGYGLVVMAVFNFYDRTGAPAWRHAIAAAAFLFYGANLAVMQRGFQRGRAAMVVTINTVVANVVAIVGGMLVLGQRPGPDALSATLQIVAMALAVLSMIPLAWSEQRDRLGAPSRDPVANA